MFQFSQLRCFVAVANELHFGRAAARLHMTQPPLTRQIQLLEEVAGIRLFERSSRTVALTPAGKVFLAEAEYILQRSQDAILLAQQAERGDVGMVSLGFISAASYEFLPRILARLRIALPHLEIALREMSSVDQRGALLAGKINLGLIRHFACEPDIETVCVACDPFILALPVVAPLFHKEAITLSDLDGQNYIMYPPVESKYFYELLSGLFLASGVRPRYVQYLSQDHTILSLVGAGIGMALVPASARRLMFPGVGFRHIDLGRKLEAELHVAWRTDNQHPAHDRILNIISKERNSSGGGLPAGGSLF